MWTYYGYKILLPAFIILLALFLFIKLKYYRVHHGWWLAFLIFSFALAFTLPVKTNPFQENLTTHLRSKEIVQKLSDLTNRPFFSDVTLKDNVTEKDIKSLESQLPFVEKGRQNKAKNYLEKAWEGYEVQQIIQFFVEKLNFDSESEYQLLTMDNVKIEDVETAQKLLENMPSRKEKIALKAYFIDVRDYFDSQKYKNQ